MESECFFVFMCLFFTLRKDFTAEGAEGAEDNTLWLKDKRFCHEGTKSQRKDKKIMVTNT